MARFIQWDRGPAFGFPIVLEAESSLKTSHGACFLQIFSK
jgi:hypothetical protein